MHSANLITTIALADPREVFRNGLASILTSVTDLKVVASVSTCEEALQVCRSHQVSILLLCEEFPDYVNAPASIAAALPADVRALVICRNLERELEFIEAGFWGCLPQTATAEQIIRAIAAVTRGEYWARRGVLTRFIRERLGGTYPPHDEGGSSAQLTRREVEILELVARGYNNDQIATALFIGRSTVKTHLLRAFRKLEAVDRASAVNIALSRKLIRSHAA